jgi:hypothetical protein
MRWLVFVGLLAISCDRGQPAKATAPVVPVAAAAPVSAFGQPLSAAPALPLSQVLANPDSYGGKTLTVDGRVRAACTRKGCWMELAGEGPGPGCRVTFKDYGFFVPTNSAGANARVEGTLEVRSVDAAQVAHLESEGAKFAAKTADGSAKELRMVATGVQLSRPTQPN